MTGADECRQTWFPALCRINRSRTVAELFVSLSACEPALEIIDPPESERPVICNAAPDCRIIWNFLDATNVTPFCIGRDAHENRCASLTQAVPTAMPATTFLQNPPIFTVSVAIASCPLVYTVEVKEPVQSPPVASNATTLGKAANPIQTKVETLPADTIAASAGGGGATLAASTGRGGAALMLSSRAPEKLQKPGKEGPKARVVARTIDEPRIMPLVFLKEVLNVSFWCRSVNRTGTLRKCQRQLKKRAVAEQT